MDTIRDFFATLGATNMCDDIENRLRAAVNTSICHWLLLKNARKNEKKIIEKRLPLLRLEDGYTVQHHHLCTQDAVEPGTSLHHDALCS